MLTRRHGRLALAAALAAVALGVASGAIAAFLFAALTGGRLFIATALAALALAALMLFAAGWLLVRDCGPAADGERDFFGELIGLEFGAGARRDFERRAGRW